VRNGNGSQDIGGDFSYHVPTKIIEGDAPPRSPGFGASAWDTLLSFITNATIYT